MVTSKAMATANSSAQQRQRAVSSPPRPNEMASRRSSDVELAGIVEEEVRAASRMTQLKRIIDDDATGIVKRNKAKVELLTLEARFASDGIAGRRLSEFSALAGGAVSANKAKHEKLIRREDERRRREEEIRRIQEALQVASTGWASLQAQLEAAQRAVEALDAGGDEVEGTSFPESTPPIRTLNQELLPNDCIQMSNGSADENMMEAPASGSVERGGIGINHHDATPDQDVDGLELPKLRKQEQRKRGKEATSFAGKCMDDPALFLDLDLETDRLIDDYQHFLTDIDKRNTNHLIGNYHRFLSDMGMDTESRVHSIDDDGSGRRWPQTSGSRGEDNDTTPTRASDAVVGCWHRSKPEGELLHNSEPNYVAPDEENSSPPGVYDCDGDLRKASGYRFLFCQNYRAGAMASVLAIVFLAVVFTGENRQPAGEAIFTHSSPGDTPAEDLAVAFTGENRQPAGEAISTRSNPGDPPAEDSALSQKEIAVMLNMDPRWYGRKDGYKGTNHQEAVGFCMSRGQEQGGRQLCPPEAYCPNGPPRPGDADPRPLIFGTAASPREQWAASALNPNSWVLIGTVDGDPTRTCETHDTLHGGAQPLWGLDGTSKELKQHVLCCKRSSGNYGNVIRDEQQKGPLTPPNNGGSRNSRQDRFSILLMMVVMKGIFPIGA